MKTRCHCAAGVTGGCHKHGNQAVVLGGESAGQAAEKAGTVILEGEGRSMEQFLNKGGPVKRDDGGGEIVA